MLRPYLAIIKDAFRAALASRVLYVLFALITVLLVIVAPLHVYETVDWEIDGGRHIFDSRALSQRLFEQRQQQPIIARIFDRLPQELQANVEKWSAAVPDGEASETNRPRPRRPRRGGDPPPRFDAKADQLADGLNRVIESPDFYSAEVWQGKFLAEEAQALVDRGVDQLTPLQRNRLHRLLITSALAPDLQPASSTYLEAYYAIWPVSFLSTPGTLQQFGQNAISIVSWIFDKFVLSIGLFIAILVTSNMIPETFDPGSLNLLLSKPIHRWGLLISKFFGGCVFITILGGYLFLGFWLWLGLAFGVWDQSMLWSIPLYVLVFAIYFSVSVFVGIIYRSAVVSVVITVLFWAICFGVGSLHNLFYTKLENERLVRLAEIGDQVVGMDALQRVFLWDGSASQWKSGIKATSTDPGQEIALGVVTFFVKFPPQPVMTPIYDSQQQQTLALSANIFDPESIGQAKLFRATDRQLTFTSLGIAPHAAVALLQTKHGPILVGGDGYFYRLRFDSNATNAEPSRDNVAESRPTGNGQTMANEDGTTDMSQNVVKCGPNEPQPVPGPESIAYNDRLDEIYLFKRGNLYAYASNDRQEYQLVRQKAVQSGSSNPTIACHVATANDHIVLAFGNGQLVSLDAATFAEKHGYRCESRSPPTQLVASPSGRWFAALYRNGRTWILDTQNPDAMSLAAIPDQGQHFGVCFDSRDQLLLSHNFDRGSRINLETGAITERLYPSGDFLKKMFRWGVRPLYSVFPKPGEFYKLVSHLSSSSDARINADVDLSETVEYQNPWSPLWTGLSFMAVCLCLACLYFQRSDF